MAADPPRRVLREPQSSSSSSSITLNATMSATNVVSTPASPPMPTAPLVNSTSTSAKADDRALISMLDELLDGVSHGDAHDTHNFTSDGDDDAINARRYQANSTLHDARVRLFPCSSCKHKLEASAFEPDRKTCRECLRRRRLRNQRKSRKLLKQRLRLLEDHSANAHASTTT